MTQCPLTSTTTRLERGVSVGLLISMVILQPCERSELMHRLTKAPTLPILEIVEVEIMLSTYRPSLRNNVKTKRYFDHK